MGVVRMGIPQELVLEIINIVKTDIFIETGTYYGETSSWASKHFKNVHTIEYSEPIFTKAKNNLSAFKNVNTYFGDSRSNLQTIYNNNSKSALLWLDAHWCSGLSYGQNDQCPLLDELDVINAANNDDIILIDDARLFLAPPPFPNSVEYYPDWEKLTESLLEINRYIVLFQDVIIAFPYQHRNTMEGLMQRFTTKEWESKHPKKTKDKIYHSLKLMKQIVKTWV